MPASGFLRNQKGRIANRVREFRARLTKHGAFNLVLVGFAFLFIDTIGFYGVLHAPNPPILTNFLVVLTAAILIVGVLLVVIGESIAPRRGAQAADALTMVVLLGVAVWAILVIEAIGQPAAFLSTWAGVASSIIIAIAAANFRLFQPPAPDQDSPPAK